MLLWKDRVVVSGITSTPNYISYFMKLENIPINWHFSGFYGEPNVSKRRVTWDMLEHLRIVYEGPWLVIGDFNDISSQNDKTKSGYKNETEIEDFRSTLELCALHPLHYKGERYTWAKSADNGSMKERLDWAMDDTDPQEGSNKRKRFRFENIWIGDEECLFNEDHIWCTSNEAICDITKNYYSALFTSIMPTNESIEELLQVVEQVVTDDMNETLTKTFTLEEVQRAVFSMPADKSPGPDGMSALFYQEHWILLAL
uniref:Endonuclease/exonuclease/phosphatase domain-containing protein n=1 Tax=Cannabis sativa TaxID=3483 RepID=A0A803QRF3_CANSA